MAPLRMHMLLNILLKNCKRDVISYRPSSPCLVNFSQSKILRPHEKPWLEHVVLETYLVTPSLRRSQKCKKACWGKQHPHFHISADIQLSALSSVVFIFLLCWGKSNLPGLSLHTAFSLPSLFHREYVGSSPSAVQGSRAAVQPIPYVPLSSTSGCTEGTMPQTHHNNYQGLVLIRPYQFLKHSKPFQFQSKDCHCGLPDYKVN